MLRRKIVDKVVRHFGRPKPWQNENLNDIGSRYVYEFFYALIKRSL